MQWRTQEFFPGGGWGALRKRGLAGTGTLYFISPVFQLTESCLVTKMCSLPQWKIFIYPLGGGEEYLPVLYNLPLTGTENNGPYLVLQLFIARYALFLIVQITASLSSPEPMSQSVICYYGSVQYFSWCYSVWSHCRPGSPCPSTAAPCLWSSSMGRRRKNCWGSPVTGDNSDGV